MPPPRPPVPPPARLMPAPVGAVPAPARRVPAPAGAVAPPARRVPAPVSRKSAQIRHFVAGNNQCAHESPVFRTLMRAIMKDLALLAVACDG